MKIIDINNRGSLTYNIVKGEIVLLNLYVKQKYRRKGVATSLLQQLKELANKEQKDIKLMALPLMGNISQEELEKFYENNGFVKKGRYFFYKHDKCHCF